jgi:hypothetical protein
MSYTPENIASDAITAAFSPRTYDEVRNERKSTYKDLGGTFVESVASTPENLVT